MVTIDDAEISPGPLPQRPLDPWVRYDADSDTLLIYFFGAPEPAISYPVPGDRYAYLRIDLETHAIIGLQIEGVLAGFLRDHPEFIDFARQYDVPEQALRRIETEVGASVEAERRTHAMVRLLMADVEHLASASCRPSRAPQPSRTVRRHARVAGSQAGSASWM